MGGPAQVQSQCEYIAGLVRTLLLTARRIEDGMIRVGLATGNRLKMFADGGELENCAFVWIIARSAYIYVFVIVRI